MPAGTEEPLGQKGDSSLGRRPDFDVVIIGAGMSGLYALHRMRQMGLRVRVYERAGDVGGTWWWNRYPGARVDSPGAPFYGYTFCPEIVTTWDWSETQPDQPAILSYISHVADKYDLRKDIVFDCPVLSARWVAPLNLWEIDSKVEGTVAARFVISAVGTLSDAYLPDIPGIENFRGALMHPSRWPHEPINFEGLRVGVIGTGSSGVQIIPRVAEKAERVVVFQRTPQFVIPGRNRPLLPEILAEVRENWESYRSNLINTGRPTLGSSRLAVEATPAERLAEYEKAWNQGGMALRETFKDHLTDERANGAIAEFVRAKIRQIVRDPQTAEKLVPDYHFGVKRLILGEGYYEAYNRPNVALVDLREDPITQIRDHTVHTRSTSYCIDLLVLATGYDALTGALTRLNPIGIDGVGLAKRWATGARTFLGLAVNGFPNLFILHGPQSPSVKFHMGLGAELQSDWIAECIDHMCREGHATIQATIEAEDGWAEEVARAADGTLFTKVDSWFMGSNIPGKPKQFLIHLNGPGYYARLKQVSESGYVGFSFT